MLQPSDDRMKSQVKKGNDKADERSYDGIRVKFQKLMGLISVWKHYINQYYKEREKRYYDELYRRRAAKSARVGKDATTLDRITDSKDRNLNEGGFITENDTKFEKSFSEMLEEGPFTESPKADEKMKVKDEFYRISITFYIEELFIYILEILNVCAGLAFV